MNIETENIEFKSQFTEDIYKEVIAFANTDGGIVYVGIDNNGNAVGLTDVDHEYTRITNGIRDAIMPDVTMFARFTIQENKVVRITVNHDPGEQGGAHNGKRRHQQALLPQRKGLKA